MVELTARSRDDWETLASRSFVPVSIASVASDFVGTMEHFEAGLASLTRVTSAGCHVTRTPGLIARSSPDVLLFSLQLRGKNDVFQSSRVAHVNPGQSVLYMAEYPYSLLFPTHAQLVILQIPVSYVGVSRSDLERVAARPLSVRGDRALPTYATVVRSFLDGNAAWRDPSDAIRVGIELVGDAIRRQVGLEPRKRHSRDTLLARLCRFVQDNLTDPRLDVALLARVEGVSIRTVYIAFERLSTTPAHYIRAARLRHAKSMLESTTFSITEVAAACGFVDTTTFIRAFRRAYETTPAAYRGEYREHRIEGRSNTDVKTSFGRSDPPN
ncbi:helix-turn-helix domain-containing protein [Gryllotalpicola ginsengisoli]|uniref:helix-turn-helix domain-containing protein n=1 Tax=Gryllotalpicola ginsengisoli TaxID=444608 RepID=UPI0003B678F3|nr:helix-turn-helix domain-containing protein [Gryllotalpicola ginsengisoli]